MLRRVLAPEPYARAATFSLRSANFAALLALMAVGLGRSGAVEPKAVLAVLAAGLTGAAVALASAGCAAVTIWRTGRRGSGRAVAGVGVALLVLGYPAFLTIAAFGLPALNDISTDVASPPAFAATPQAIAARNGALHPDPPLDLRDEQRRAYPGVQPVLLDADGVEAYRLVLKTLSARGWRVIETSAPKGRFGIGHIDAVARSRIMGFPEDVTIRIRPSAGQTRVDIRSASRIERHDVGANAARIQSFAEDLQNAE